MAENKFFRSFGSFLFSKKKDTISTSTLHGTSKDRSIEIGSEMSASESATGSECDSSILPISSSSSSYAVTVSDKTKYSSHFAASQLRGVKPTLARQTPKPERILNAGTENGCSKLNATENDAGVRKNGQAEYYQKSDTDVSDVNAGVGKRIVTFAANTRLGAIKEEDIDTGNTIGRRYEQRVTSYRNPHFGPNHCYQQERQPKLYEGDEENMCDYENDRDSFMMSDDHSIDFDDHNIEYEGSFYDSLCTSSASDMVCSTLVPAPKLCSINGHKNKNNDINNINNIDIDNINDKEGYSKALVHFSGSEKDCYNNHSIRFGSSRQQYRKDILVAKNDSSCMDDKYNPEFNCDDDYDQYYHDDKILNKEECLKNYQNDRTQTHCSIKSKIPHSTNAVSPTQHAPISRSATQFIVSNDGQERKFASTEPDFLKTKESTTATLSTTAKSFEAQQKDKDGFSTIKKRNCCIGLFNNCSGCKIITIISLLLLLSYTSTIFVLRWQQNFHSKNSSSNHNHQGSDISVKSKTLAPSTSPSRRTIHTAGNKNSSPLPPPIVRKSKSSTSMAMKKKTACTNVQPPILSPVQKGAVVQKQTISKLCPEK